MTEFRFRDVSTEGGNELVIEAETKQKAMEEFFQNMDVEISEIPPHTRIPSFNPLMSS